jgi:hypothetical protein
MQRTTKTSTSRQNVSLLVPTGVVAIYNIYVYARIYSCLNLFRYQNNVKMCVYLF